jgi:hypothetical protein
VECLWGRRSAYARTYGLVDDGGGDGARGGVVHEWGRGTGTCGKFGPFRDAKYLLASG